MIKPIAQWPALAAALTWSISGLAASESESWEREFAFAPGSAPRLHVENVWGKVVVRGHDSPNVVVQAVETRSARSADDLARISDYIWLEIRDHAEGVSLEVDNDDDRHHWAGRCHRCELHVDFEILVPRDAHVDVSSVMDGRVEVGDVDGPVKARHVNGDVTVTNIRHCQAMETVNGELDVEFAAPPTADCKLETVNGDLVVRLPAESGLDVLADLFNGRVVSDFDLTGMATEPKVEKSASRGGTHYRISSAMGLRLGAGGPRFEFESINGDVVLRRR